MISICFSHKASAHVYLFITQHSSFTNLAYSIYVCKHTQSVDTSPTVACHLNEAYPFVCSMLDLRLLFLSFHSFVLSDALVFVSSSSFSLVFRNAHKSLAHFTLSTTFTHNFHVTYYSALGTYGFHPHSDTTTHTHNDCGGSSPNRRVKP